MTAPAATIDPPDAAPPPADRRWAGPILTCLVTAIGLGICSSLGLGQGVNPVAGVASVLLSLLTSGALALAYLAGAAGLGRPLIRLVAPTAEARLTLQLAIGLAAMLALSHVMGLSGLLSFGSDWAGAASRVRIAAWAPVVVGLALLADQVLRAELRPERWPEFPVALALGAPALALTLVASCSPPGWLWESEFGGFDSLSYHLQLPKEWLCGERLWPTTHNVYSFLPSYFEGAFMHLGAMAGPGDQRLPCTAPMVGGDGTALVACQQLHSLVAALGALLVGRCVLSAVAPMQSREGRAAARTAGIIAGAVSISVPWIVVVSSLAYNESAVNALLAGALLAALDRGAGPVRRALLAGLLVGAACSCKPTAAFLGAPVIGLVLLGRTPWRNWPAMIATSSLGGLAIMSPWLIRNSLACGNPVFPFATRLFGPGPWTQEQIHRYAAGHAFDGGPLERLEQLFSMDRGVLHPQWSVFFLIGAIGFIGALARPQRRSLAALLLAGVILQLIAWLSVTHLQSRFLTPLVVPICVTLGLGATATEGRQPRTLQRVSVLLAAAAPLLLSLISGDIFFRQMERAPNLFLPVGVAGLSGYDDAPALAAMTPAEREEFLATSPNPMRALNLLLDDRVFPATEADAPRLQGGDVYFLGNSTPLYALPAAPGWSHGGRIIYHTTWDTSPLGEAIRNTAPGEVSSRAWTAALRSRGIGYVLVNFAELERLCVRDGWYDPSVNPELVLKWLSESATLLRSWPNLGLAPPAAGEYLFRLEVGAKAGPR